VAALQAVADRVVAVGDDASEARTFSTGVWIRGAIGDEVGDERLTWETLATLRLGLVTALARPERLVASLARHRLAPSVIVRARDHGAIPVAALRAAAPVDLWIASPKCALHARPALHAAFGARSGPPLGVLDQTVALGPSLAARLRGLAWLDPASPGQ
jgi:hypothetical protein